MDRLRLWSVVAMAAAVLGWAGAAQAAPYAAEVISYVEGNYPQSGYTDPAAALGAPSSQTPGWPSGTVDVTVFNGPWGTDQLVSMGPGGSLVVKFDHAVSDQTAGTGIDLLIYGNSYLIDTNYPFGQVDANGTIYADPIQVAVSQDGFAWHQTGIVCTPRFPTMGFTDTSDPYGSDGSTVSDFTRPLEASLSLAGKTYSEIQAAYGGAGGGIGVDFHGTGLDWIQYVRVSVDADAEVDDSEVDAIVEAAPEPCALAALAAGAPLLLRRPRRRAPIT